MTNHERILQEGSAAEKREWMTKAEAVDAALDYAEEQMWNIDQKRQQMSTREFARRRLFEINRACREFLKGEETIGDPELGQMMAIATRVQERLHVRPRIRALVIKELVDRGHFPAMIQLPASFW